MKRTTRNALVTAAALLPFLLLTLWVPSWLGLSGWVARLAPLTFLVLGLSASFIVGLYLRARAKAFPEPADDDDTIDAAVARARRRLSASALEPLGKQPVVLFLGASGSTKTTAIIRSGIEPELLSGEVQRGEGVVPTRVNVWFADGAVIVEAGGPIAEDASRFSRLIGHLRPSRLPAILPGRAQAPRAAVVCFACDELLRPDAIETAVSAAQRLRAQLVEAAARFGVRLPVYVLFTKADTLPFFADYVRNLTRDEAADVLGATLPIGAPNLPGSYAEQESARIGSALDGIVRSLALRRLELLAREPAEDVRGNAFEFPRELRKAATLATQLLVDLCRPSQLGVSPFLRGFYFTGVRPVTVDDVRAPSTPLPDSRAVDATTVFDPTQSWSRPPRPALATSGRRVPEWMFLRRVLGQLVLRDDVARVATEGGSRVDLLRRALVSAAGAVLLLLSLTFLVSWRANSHLLDAAVRAARGAERLMLTGDGVPRLDDLAELDSMRVDLARLRDWAVSGAPASHRWGLFVGDDVLATLRPLYFDRFERLVWADGRARLASSLERLPATPNETSEYGPTYGALKAYLITTSHAHESTAEFLAPELLKHWRIGRDVDPARAALIERQLAFFARELPYGNPFGDTPHDALVARTRAFLRSFGDVDQLYQALITEASKVTQPVRFADTDGVRDAVVVPGAFTAAGWDFVQSNLQAVGGLFARESWVLGDAGVPEADRARIGDALGARYLSDYVQQWQGWLAGADVSGFRDVQDAAAKLRVLSGPRSPLLRLLAVASQNTGVDSVSLARAFQPVHVVLPPAVTDRLIIEGVNQSYMQALVGLQAALDPLVTSTAAGPARGAALDNARGAAEQAKIQVQQLAQRFIAEGDAQPVGTAVERLLLAPIRSAEGLLSALPSAELNATAQSFCAQVSPLFGKFPFDARSTLEATVNEVSAMFLPGSSALWSFYDANVRQLLVPQGGGFGRVAGAPLEPTSEFTAFFNRMAEISRALFAAEGASGPEVAFELRPEPSAQVTEIRVEIDGQTQSVTATSRASRTFIWQAESGRNARIEATVGGERVIIARAKGPWAVFRLFHQADPAWEFLAPGHYRLRWRVPASNTSLSAELRFDERVPVFDPGYFRGLQCVSRMVAR